jgi:hypothetical protein
MKTKSEISNFRFEISDRGERRSLRAEIYGEHFRSR